MIRSTRVRSVSGAEKRWLKVFRTLNEFQARLFAADKALDLGRGGISRLAALTGLSRTTITKAVDELEGGGKLVDPGEGRVRRAGGGRKKVEEVDPAVRELLRKILEETTAGDPMSLLRWTSKSTRTMAAELTRLGHPVTWVTVARCLDDMGYSLQANRKKKEGPQHANRDAQFRYINRQVKAVLGTGNPVISVDAKKKELVGPFKNAGRTWRPKGKPQDVNTKDFPSLAAGKALPYGIYDSGQNRAVVNVGVTHDTAEFAVESIRRWWKLDGRKTYPAARRLLICADAGGSNGNRLRAWKLNLQQMADQIRIPITVCHYPPGTSKWNKIEHRLFSFISLNWRGQPLLNHETIINLIGGTKTRTGLKVKAVLDKNEYETGIKVSDEELEEIQLRRHKLHPTWNYTISPRQRK
jgi:DNA-binding MarR family transcriptional regulator